ncbi:PaaX family transcriptional regulator [Alcanivorax sp. JB21]|uniref:PaaX family transcriptional regulator C-terminal domain-containing protein n=1 Tax=Alcanivorax limicola TaxID=2874102 RepID=UPI001CBFF73F|nr:PaaX family transcriptional regulator C-terminal domain-containing protein [Alcanivorax limicola]MBZ2190101.1 PaaX family transcriptional regulator [Alcanivorax limicola]
MQLNPKDLILTLLLAADDRELEAREAVSACALFGVRANSVRVALVRLNAAGLIEAVGRGSYRLGAKAVGLAGELGLWKQAEARIRPWQGDWLMVHTGELKRSDKPAMNRRQRALRLAGFEALQRDIYLRPDNLVEDIAALRQRLQRLGLDAEALVWRAQALDPASEAQARTLWDGPALTAQYRESTRRIREWLAKMPALDLDEAARESFLLGNAVIRQMIYDPLLPDPLVDSAARRDCLAAVQDIDEVGHDIWRRLRDAAFSAAPESAGSVD